MFWFKLIIGSFILAIVIGSFVYGQAVVASYTHQISTYSSKLEELRSFNDQLEIRLVSRNFISNNVTNNRTKTIKAVEHIVVSSQDKITSEV